MADNMDREDWARLLLAALQFREETIHFNRDQDTRCWRDAMLQAEAIMSALVSSQQHSVQGE